MKCTAVQNTLGWSAIVSCACEFMLLLSVVFMGWRAIGSFACELMLLLSVVFLGRRAVVSCVCELMLLLSVVFLGRRASVFVCANWCYCYLFCSYADVQLCLVRANWCSYLMCAVRFALCIKLAVGLLWTEHITKSNQCNVVDSIFSQHVCFFRKLSPDIADPTHAFKAKPLLVSS